MSLLSSAVSPIHYLSQSSCIRHHGIEKTVNHLSESNDMKLNLSFRTTHFISIIPSQFFGLNSKP